MGCVNPKPNPNPNQAINQQSNQPTIQPTNQTSNQQSNLRSNQQSNQPTNQPTKQQNNVPTNQQTNQPIKQPTNQPSNQPTNQLSNQATHPSNPSTNKGTNQPNKQINKQPTNQATKQPTKQPSNQATNHHAAYWLKWTAGNDVSGRASGLGRRGWNVVLGGSVLYVLHWSISFFPSCTQIWCWVNNGFRHHDLLCANVDGVPHQKSIKTTNGFSLYFAIVMDVSVHSSCFAYSEDPDCSVPGAPELQTSWKCP